MIIYFFIKLVLYSFRLRKVIDIIHDSQEKSIFLYLATSIVFAGIYGIFLYIIEIERVKNVLFYVFIFVFMPLLVVDIIKIGKGIVDFIRRGRSANSTSGNRRVWYMRYGSRSRNVDLSEAQGSHRLIIDKPVGLMVEEAKTTSKTPEKKAPWV
jgi:hypothetical protein